MKNTVLNGHFAGASFDPEPVHVTSSKDERYGKMIYDKFHILRMARYDCSVAPREVALLKLYHPGLGNPSKVPGQTDLHPHHLHLSPKKARTCDGFRTLRN